MGGGINTAMKVQTLKPLAELQVAKAYFDEFKG